MSFQSILDAIETETHPDSAEFVLSELCASTNENEVRDVLRLYKLELTTKQLTNKFNSPLKQTLEKTATYLGCSQVGAKEPEIILNIICRIQNLFPEICQICSKKYTIKKDDPPFLNCDVCGQEVHRECYSKLFGLGENEMLDIKPKNLPGLHYLCKPCKGDRIPKEKIPTNYRPADSWLTCEQNCPYRVRSWDSSLICAQRTHENTLLSGSLLSDTLNESDITFPAQSQSPFLTSTQTVVEPHCASMDAPAVVNQPNPEPAIETVPVDMVSVDPQINATTNTSHIANPPCSLLPLPD